MPKITWDGIGEKLFETGVDHGVIYLYDTQAKKYGGKEGMYAAWNGLTSVTESPDGAEPTDLYADNIKYASMRSAETFGGTIEAYTYPPEFEVANGEASPLKGMVIGQQSRATFGLCYRTGIGSDVSQDYETNYKLHLIYGCTCSPSERSYETVNDSPDAISFSWEYTTTPVNVPGFKPTASIVIDSTKVDKTKLKALEEILYGTESGDTQPTLPLPEVVISTLQDA